MKAMKTWILTIGLMCIALGSNALAEECRPEFFKYTKNYKLDEVTSLSIAWMMSEEEYKQASKEVGGEAEIFGIPMGGDYSEFKSNISKRVQQLRLDNFEQRAVAYAMSGFDDNGRKAYRDCIIGQGGMDLSALQIGKSSYQISVFYAPRVNDTKKAWKLVNATNLATSFKPQFETEIGGLEPMGRVERSFTIMPESRQEEVTIDIARGKGESKTVTLPPLELPVSAAEPIDPQLWMYHSSPKVTDGGTLDTARKDLLTWIQKDCHPDSFESVRGFIAQGGQAQPYFIHVYCYAGKGALGKVDMQISDWQQGAGALLAVQKAAKGGFAILGWRFGLKDSNLFLLVPKS